MKVKITTTKDVKEYLTDSIVIAGAQMIFTPPSPINEEKAEQQVVNLKASNVKNVKVTE